MDSTISQRSSNRKLLIAPRPSSSMQVDFNRLRDSLKQFDFHELFVNDLGWSQPTSRQDVPFTVKESSFVRRQIAQLAGVAVFEVTAEDGRIPDAKTRAAVHK